MNPIIVPFWVISGVAVAMISTSISLAIKIRLLKKSKFVEKGQKSQITDLSSRTSALTSDLTETKQEFEKTQKQLGEFKDITARENAEINALKKSLESIVKERDLFLKDNAAQKQNIAHQEKEFEKANGQRVKLEGDLKELLDTKKAMAEKIQGLESSVAELNQLKTGHLETLGRQKRELEQLHSQISDIKSALQNKEQDIGKFDNVNRGMAIKIQELEVQVKELIHVNEADQKAIANQQKELKQVTTQRAELSNNVAAKEQQIFKFQDENKAMAEKIQELGSRLKVFGEDTVSSQQVITNQEQELERVLKQDSELRDALGEEKHQIIKLEDTTRQMAEKIQALESSVAELSRMKAEHLEVLSRQKHDLERAITQNSQLQSTVKEKELHIQKLEDSGRTLSAQLKEDQAAIQGLQKATQAQAIIIAEMKKEDEKKKQPAKAAESKDELAAIRDKNAAQLPELLSANRLVAEAQLKKALRLQEKYKGSLLRFLFTNRDVDERELVDCISTKLGLGYLPLGDYRISKQASGLMPSRIVEEYWLLPVEKVADTITVAMVDPFENAAIQKIQELTGCKVQAYPGLFSEIAEKIQDLYQVNIRGLDAEGNLVSPIFIDTAEYKGRERRRANRLETKIAIRVADDERAVSSTTKDICWDGLSFKLGQELPIYKNVTVQLTLVESAKDQKNQLFVPGVAEVIRATPLKDNSFMIGLKLIKMSQEDLGLIIKRAYKEKQRIGN
jgi:septal ring factor EnvC (AmiA/AmiB activator)